MHIHFFIAAVLSFLFLCLDIVLAFCESIIYKAVITDLSHDQLITHWKMIIVLWSLSALAIIFYGRRYCNYNAFTAQFKPARKASILGFSIPIGCITALTVIYGKPGFVRLVTKAPDLAVFQYAYAAFEMLLAALLISFAQKGFDAAGVNPRIPTGGIALAVSWGLIHYLTKGSWSVALIVSTFAIVYGIIHNLLGKDLRKSWPLMYLLFIWL